MLKDKVVIVTGGGQGIGKHAARTFAQEQAKVVIADFSQENAKKTANELAALSETLPVVVDVREEDSVKRMVEQVINRFGQIDVHINNAAIVPHFAWGIPRWPRISEMPMTMMMVPVTTGGNSGSRRLMNGAMTRPNKPAAMTEP